MKIGKLSQAEGESIFRGLMNGDHPTASTLKSDSEKELREKLLLSHEYYKEEYQGSRAKYLYDLEMALDIYETVQLNERQASDKDYFRFINLRLIPESLIYRWGLKDQKSIHDRYFSGNWRLYTHGLWWFIHIGWQGNREETFSCLKEGTTDHFVAIIERPSREGYDLNLSRELLKTAFSSDRKHMRSVMKRHTLWLGNRAPPMHKNQYRGFVEDIYSKFREAESTE
jgi:hypothetical protein